MLDDADGNLNPGRFCRILGGSGSILDRLVTDLGVARLKSKQKP
jgi:hypothetical protein